MTKNSQQVPRLFLCDEHFDSTRELCIRHFLRQRNCISGNIGLDTTLPCLLHASDILVCPGCPTALTCLRDCLQKNSHRLWCTEGATQYLDRGGNQGQSPRGMDGGIRRNAGISLSSQVFPSLFNAATTHLILTFFSLYYEHLTNYQPVR